MILRTLILGLALGSSLTSPLFAGTARGDRLISEAGGSQGVAGVAGPAGAPGIAGAAGAAGIPGIPGIPGTNGILDFADFYALMPSDNAAVVAPGNAVFFPQIGSTAGVIVPTNPGAMSSTFLLPVIGTYLVQFQVSVTEAAQLMLRLNGALVANSVVSRATGASQLVGISLLTTTVVNSILEVINPPGNTPAPGITITPLAGGTGAMPASVGAHLTITRIQ